MVVMPLNVAAVDNIVLLFMTQDNTTDDYIKPPGFRFTVYKCQQAFLRFLF